MGSDAARLLEAADFAAGKHKEQRRKDPEGTPFINHPIGAEPRPCRTTPAPASRGPFCPRALPVPGIPPPAPKHRPSLDPPRPPPGALRPGPWREPRPCLPAGV